MITWIRNGPIDYHLAIGELSDVLRPHIIMSNHFLHLLNLTQYSEKISELYRGKNIWIVHSPILTDPSKDHDSYARFVLECESAYYSLSRIKFAYPSENVLVFCVAGMDRSPFVVAKYLVDNMSYSWGDAYSLIKKCRPQAIEHYEWIPETWERV